MPKGNAPQKDAGKSKEGKKGSTPTGKRKAKCLRKVKSVCRKLQWRLPHDDGGAH